MFKSTSRKKVSVKDSSIYKKEMIDFCAKSACKTGGDCEKEWNEFLIDNECASLVEIHEKMLEIFSKERV